MIQDRISKREAVKNPLRTDGFDILIEAILIVMIVLPPLALGSVAPWARSVSFFLAVILLALWFTQGAWRGRLLLARNSIWLFILAFFALAFVQLIPFSPDTVKSISPGTWQCYARALADYPGSGEARSLSLCPYATGTEIIRLATLTIVFLIVINVVRTRWQAVGIILALAAIGSFEAMYGFAEQFSGHKHIFWLPRRYHLAAVTGTFLNKNHFAGLLEMIVPVSLGLLFAIGRRRAEGRAIRPTGRTARKLLLTTFSTSAVYQQAILAALSII
ncbi:MAG: hypothetical protein JSV16_00835, partial [Candidatus Hydrogenedentota bacterium]